MALEAAPFRVPVTFSIVGVQKAATSSLFRMLTKHPAIAGGPEKEMRHFMMEDLDWNDPDLSDYARPAQRRTVTSAGDATPAYLFWPHALERMRRFRPNLSLIGSFRDPIERALSQWSMERSRDAAFPDIPDAIATFDLDRVPGEVPAEVSPIDLRRHSLFTRGLYGQQLRNGLAHFPREQWLFLDFADLRTDRLGVLDRVTDFLDLPRFTTHPEEIHQNRTPQTHHGRPATTVDIGRLVEVYARDLPQFAELSGIDVSGWATSRVISGALALDDFTTALNVKLGLA